MTHKNLKDKFMLWWQKENPKGRIFDNNTGFAKFGKSLVPYGFPPPIINKKESGGGPDCIACPGGGDIEFYEVKRFKDRIKKNQKRAAEMCTRLGFKVFIVRESENNLGFEIILLVD
jgi:hypothetical protein